MPYIQANSNGRLHDASQPSISPLDRGFLYGDSVYEVWRTFGDHVFAFGEHWERLERSAGAIGLDLPVDRSAAIAEIARTIAAYRQETSWSGCCYIRLQISRGSGPIGLDSALADGARFFLYVQKLTELTPAQLEGGLRLHPARRFQRNLRTAVDPSSKTGNYMNNLLCLREAKEAGADDVVMFNQAGEVTEAATANLFFVSGNRVVTPPLSSGILGGVTRQLLLYRIEGPGGLQLIERRIPGAEMEAFDECFLASTTRDVVPVAAIGGKGFRTGAGTVSRQLKRAFETYLNAYPGTKYTGFRSVAGDCRVDGS